MTNGVIYKAEHIESGRVYIGASRFFDNRKKLHSYADTIFGRALREYGEEAFKWEVLERDISPRALGVREKVFIKKFDAQNREKGFNRNSGGGRFKFKDATKPLINARVSQEVYDWVIAAADASKRSMSEYLFLLLEEAILLEKTAKIRRRKC